jgi:hypothetical protein
VLALIFDNNAERALRMSDSRHISLVRYRYDPLDRLVDRAPGDQPGQQSFYQKNALACEIHGQMCRPDWSFFDVCISGSSRRRRGCRFALGGSC